MRNDPELLADFRRGSPQALQDIYEKYRIYLMSLAVALLNDTYAAEDVLHDFFVSFAESPGIVRDDGKLKSFMATCVVNRARDRIRTCRRRANVPLDTVSTEADHVEAPDNRVIADETSRAINVALAELPYDQREVIALHLVGGLTFRRIARTLNLSANTIRSRYRYGLNKLRTLLRNEVKL